ncbi:hypothetical protein [Viridibacterium curvum]|uniref:DUF4145 domain-containing protein n=1 Tax=Viridibacterium curvum TaxID=1101404 RepID=A0ABP9R807_9RHOO
MPFDFVEPEEFFRQLNDDKEFCAGLGKVMLAAGMLETKLRSYLKARSIDYHRTATLGGLVKKLKDADLLTENGKSHFDDITKKRNYLAHNLYGLFSKELEETILPRENLVSIDASIFIDRVETLAEDFMFFSSLVAKADPLKAKLL